MSGSYKWHSQLARRLVFSRYFDTERIGSSNKIPPFIGDRTVAKDSTTLLFISEFIHHLP